MADNILEITSVTHGFGPKRVLNNVNLGIKAGQITAIVGPSGCGKSTLFRAILGTHPPQEGTICVDGKEMNGPSEKIGIVYQHYSLYDFLTIGENVMFGLKLSQTSFPYRIFKYFSWRKLRNEHRAIASKMLEVVGLPNTMSSYPRELSGGMRQRVAIAQALVMKPSILLLDEPFGALDAVTRISLQRLLLSFYKENLEAKQRGERPPHTVIIVTHELDEAIYVSDRILGLSQHYDGADGSKIIYDKPSPVFRPDEPADIDSFIEQKMEITQKVMDPDYCQSYQECLTDWSTRAEEEGRI